MKETYQEPPKANLKNNMRASKPLRAAKPAAPPAKPSQAKPEPLRAAKPAAQPAKPSQPKSHTLNEGDISGTPPIFSLLSNSLKVSKRHGKASRQKCAPQTLNPKP